MVVLYDFRAGTTICFASDRGSSETWADLHEDAEPGDLAGQLPIRSLNSSKKFRM